MNIEIKKMETEEEIKGKAYVHWRSWHETYTGMVSREYLDRLTLQKCEEIAFQWPDNIIIAKEEGRVIGFVGYGSDKEETEDAGEIFALYTLSEYHGKGIGRRLMEAGLEQLKEYSLFHLWVVKGNRRAIRFYEKFGFCPDGREKFYQTIGATGIRMTMQR